MIEEEEEDDSGNDAIFDGERLKNRMARFLSRLNHALNEAQDSLPDFEIQQIWVDTQVSLNGNVSFPSGAGIGISGSRSIQFILKPRNK